MSLYLKPCTLRAARIFINEHHRHHKAPQGGLFAVAVAEGEDVVGVCIIGKPVARMLNDGFTAEVTRVCTTGQANTCSKLYGAAWRAAKALGYRRLVTYTLESEGGASLRAGGWQITGKSRGGSWSRDHRARVDEHPLDPKLRWEPGPFPPVDTASNS